jgi:hypothetical protein
VASRDFETGRTAEDALQDEVKSGYVHLGAASKQIQAPTRATTLPLTAAERKTYPVASGLMDYFPDALVAIAHVSYRGNEQHNPGQPLHWARHKSTDEADTMLRHFLERGSIDSDGVRHSAKMAWRALALLQKEIEASMQLRAEPAEEGPRQGLLDPKTDIEREMRKMAAEQQAEAKRRAYYEEQQTKVRVLDKPAHPRSCPQSLSTLCSCDNQDYATCEMLAKARVRNREGAGCEQSKPAPTPERIYDEVVSAKHAAEAGWSEGSYHITVTRERY